MITDKISQYLENNDKEPDEAILEEVSKISSWIFRRQFMEQDKIEKKMRLSSCGACPRQQAYKLHGYPVNGKKIDARAKMIFFQGDLVELGLIQLAKLAGCPVVNTGLDQKTVSIRIKEQDVTGHPDGDIKIYSPVSPPCTETINIEVKSMSSFAFRRAEKGDIRHSTVCQSHAYMKAKNQTKTILLYQNKDSGVFNEAWIKWNDDVWEEVKERMSKVACSTPEKLPDREFTQPDKKGFEPWQCLYCAYHGHCKPKARKVLVKNRYKLKV